MKPHQPTHTALLAMACVLFWCAPSWFPWLPWLNIQHVDRITFMGPCASVAFYSLWIVVTFSNIDDNNQPKGGSQPPFQGGQSP